MTAIKERRTLRLTISFARLLMSKARSHRTSLYILLVKDKKKTTPSNINIYKNLTYQNQIPMEIVM